MTPPDPTDPYDDEEFFPALELALEFVANEPLVLAKLERYFEPRPAQLINGPDDEALLNDLEDRVTRLYGGPP